MNFRALTLYSILCTPLLDNPLIAQDYGGTGTIDMPTAFMMQDGDIKFTIATDFIHEGTSVSYQLTPWLESSFRYVGFDNSWLWDRHIEVKIKLLEESALLPAVSLGIRDIAGTAVFGGEYLVASKTYGPFQGTLGLGWGRLSGDGPITNPLSRLSDSFSDRHYDMGRGGQIATGTFFSGKSIAPFGAIAYQPEGRPFSLMLEYSSDNYALEKNLNLFREKSSINYGVRWHYSDQGWLDITNQNDEWAVGTSVLLNTKTVPNKRPGDYQSLSNEELNRVNAIGFDINRMMLFDSARRGIVFIDGEINEDQTGVTILVGKNTNHHWPDVIANTLDIMDLYLSDEIDQARLIVFDEGYQQYEIDVTLPDSLEELQSSDIAFRPLAGTYQSSLTQGRGWEPDPLNLDLDLKVRTMTFDPDNPLRYWVLLGVNLFYDLPWGWGLRGSYGLNLYDEFDDLTRTSNSVLQRVRTDQDKYLKGSKHGLDSLYFSKRGNLNAELNYEMYAGYLEMMYAGVGFELLSYDPFDRLAYGFNYSYVQQRDFDRKLGLQEFNTDTYFVSGYWDTPFYDMNMAVHVGQYLAGDKGATIEVRRSFSSGWEVGAFATFTNVSAEDFGEGSFDKGLYFTVPWSNFIDHRLARRSSHKMRLIQRDGGQYLDSFMGNNWFRLQQASPRYLQENIDRIIGHE